MGPGCFGDGPVVCCVAESASGSCVELHKSF